MSALTCQNIGKPAGQYHQIAAYALDRGIARALSEVTGLIRIAHVHARTGR